MNGSRVIKVLNFFSSPLFLICESEKKSNKKPPGRKVALKTWIARDFGKVRRNSTFYLFWVYHICAAKSLQYMLLGAELLSSGALLGLLVKALRRGYGVIWKW